MSHPNHAAHVKAERDALHNLDTCNAEGGAPGMATFWTAQWKAANERRLRTCPTCGGTMPRALGAKGYQCDACTARAESAY